MVVPAAAAGFGACAGAGDLGAPIGGGDLWAARRNQRFPQPQAFDSFAPMPPMASGTAVSSGSSWSHSSSGPSMGKVTRPMGKGGGASGGSGAVFGGGCAGGGSSGGFVGGCAGGCSSGGFGVGCTGGGCGDGGCRGSSGSTGKPPQFTQFSPRSSRLHGRVLSWDDTTDTGVITSTGLTGDCRFSLQDVPPCCQRSSETLQKYIMADAKVLFTLNLDRDGNQQALEVAPLPGVDEYVFGRVKNYGANSGYGFLRPVEDAIFMHDVYFSFKDFVDGSGELMRLKLDNAFCKFNIRFTPDGKGQAKNIEVLELPEGAQNTYEGGSTSALRRCMGTISTYKADSGFGFIKCAELNKDVWFPRRELPRDYITMDLRGAAVEFDLWAQGDEKAQARNLNVRLDGSKGPDGRTLSVSEKVAIWHSEEAARAGVTASEPGPGPAAVLDSGKPSKWG